MGHIFYVMGKSASGKDTIYKILRERLPQIRTVVPYTTRPIRAGERDGVEYYFVTGKRLADLEKQGKIIEKRTYQTIYGPWSYATVDDGQIDLGSHDYFMIGTLESYEGTRNYFGADALVPLYIWNRKCRKKTWWQQEFAVFKCEATANSVTGHVCVNSNKFGISSH